MEKISPLRAGLNAINNTFKTNKAEKTNNTRQNSSNPFGISFKGTLLQMDVFESSAKKSADKAVKDNSLAQIDKFEKTSKVEKVATNTIKDNAAENSSNDLSAVKAVKSNPFADKFNSFMSSAKEVGNNIKQNTLAFCGKVKDSFSKLATSEVSMDLFGNSVSKLSKRPVNDLEGMFKTEVAKV